MKRFSLSKRERISGETSIGLVIRQGTRISAADRKIKLLFLCSNASIGMTTARMGVAVPRKSGNAVWRNRLKRLVRDAYRRRKHELIGKCEEKNVRIDLLFFTGALTKARNPLPTLGLIEPAVREIIDKTIAKI